MFNLFFFIYIYVNICSILVFHEVRFASSTISLTKEVNNSDLLMSHKFVKLIKHFIKFWEILLQDFLLNEVAGFYLNIVWVRLFFRIAFLLKASI